MLSGLFREKHGSELFSLTHDQLSEARAAFEHLAEYEVSLAAVVDHRIKFQAPLEVQKTFSQLEKEFATSRKNIGCKEKTLSQYRSYMKVICEEFGSTIAGRTLQADVEDWLSESDWAPRTRKNYLVTLMTFFVWARDRGYIVTNPAECGLFDRHLMVSPALKILMSAASLAVVACDNHASTTVAEATPTSGATPTPAPITPVVDEKAANWKIIEDMRKGIVQSTPSPAPTIAPHLLMGDNKADYKEPTRTKAEIKAEKLSEKNHNIQDRKTENEAAENNSALDNSEHLYQWTQRYIEQAAGAGFGGLIAAHVTFGPYTTT